MDNKTKKLAHNFTIENRNKAIVTGIEKVINACDSSLYLISCDGGITITGSDLKIIKYDLDSGNLVFTGVINNIKYSHKKQNLFKKMFG